jgi:cytidylate kinase
MKDKFVIEIDGPAGSGKSTICKLVAVKLGLKYIDSGALYRTITYYFMKKSGLSQLNSLNSDFICDLDDIKVDQEYSKDGTLKVFLNSEDVSNEIRDESVTKNIGIISSDKNIRHMVTEILRKWSVEESIIMDGRDIGTVVFPNAELKIYLDASVDVRAKRRVLEYLQMGKNLDENDIKFQIMQRDEQDRNREIGSLIKAHDAVYLDTSDMSREYVVCKISDMIQNIKFNAKKDFQGN